MLSFRDEPSWGPDCADPISPQSTFDGSDDAVALTLVIASVFGAMHFITWSFSMPTLTEQWLWRSASIALTVLPILALLCGDAAMWTTRSEGIPSSVLFVLAVVLGFASSVLHPIIRLLIAIDSLVLLRNLSHTAYLVLSWSDAIPSL